MVDRIDLLHDTGASNNDRVTSVPTLEGHVQADFSSGTVHVEFDHNYDLVAEGQAQAGAGQTFVYDPRDHDQRLADFEGSIMLMYRPYRLNAEGQRIEQGFWSSFGFVLEAAPPSPVRIERITLANDTGSSDTDGHTSDPTVLGRVVDGQDANVAAPQALIEVDLNGDQLADESLTSDGDGWFRYSPRNLSPGAVTVAARPLHWNLDTQAYDRGEWSRLSFRYEAPAAPRVTQLQWEDASVSLGGGTSGIVLSGQLSGELSEVSRQEVQLDLDGDGTVDGIALSDRDGRFTHRIAAPGEGTVRVRARGTLYHAATDSTTHSDWFAEEFQLEPSVTPEIVDLEHHPDPAPDAEQDSFAAAIVTGAVRGIPADATVVVQWDHNGDGVVDGHGRTDASGAFRYAAAGLEAGEVSLRARAVAWDRRLGEMRAGDWSQLAFPWQAAPGVEPVAPGLQLLHRSQDEQGTPVTSNPIVAGSIPSLAAPAQQGGAGGRVTIELDYDGDYQFDAVTVTDEDGTFVFSPPNPRPGPLNVAARARYWDAARQTGQVGPWGELSFVYVAPRAERVVIERLELASDSGPSQEDQITANPLLLGQVPQDQAWPGMVVEFDEQDDGIIEGRTFVTADGSFAYAPRDDSLGAKTVRARAVSWDAWQQKDSAGPWRTLSYTIESQAPAPAIIAEVAAVGPVTSLGTVPEPRIHGRIVNDNALANVVIEIDTDGDALLDQTATTGSLGRFEAELTGLREGPVNVQVRTRELNDADGAVLYGEWTPLTFTLERESPRPGALGELRLVRDTGESDHDGRTWDARLEGRIDQLAGDGTTIVQFDHDEDGIVDGLADVDAEGTFTYAAEELSPGSVTIRARTRWESPGEAARLGEWTSLEFVLLPPPADAPHISELQLAHDTGLSATDRSTSDPSVRGTVVQPSSAENLAHVVYLDLDFDGVRDAEVTVNSDGAFEFTPQELPEGLVTIAARLETATGAESSGSAWHAFTFVYSEEPDSPEAVALAATITTHADSQAETEARFQAALRQGEQDYAAARHAAQEQRDRQVLEAVQLRTVGMAAAEAQFLQATSSAERAYAEAIAEAAERLDAEREGPSDGDEDYPYAVFAWPDAPPAAAPTRSARPAPPPQFAVGIEDRSHYDLSTDRVYAEQLTAAQSEFSRAANDADAERLRAREQAWNTWERVRQAAEALYQQRLRVADRTREQALAGFIPDNDASALAQADDARRQQAYDTYQSALRDNAAAYQLAIRAAQSEETSTIESARAEHEARYQEITQRYFAAVSDPELTPEARDQIEQAYYAELADNEVRTATAIAEARRQYKQVDAQETLRRESGDAAAEAAYQQAIAQSQRSRSERAAAQRQQQHAFEEEVRYDYHVTVAAAGRERELALNAAELDRTIAEAEAERRHAVSLAAAEQTRWESQARSREQAIARFAQFDPNAWSDYQHDLATHGWQFTVQQAVAQREYVGALEDAEYQRVVGIAEARRQQQDTLTDAAHDRDLEQARQLLAYGLTAVDVSHEHAITEARFWQQLAARIADAEQTLRIELASKSHDVALQVAGTERDYEVATAEIEAQRLLNVAPAEREQRQTLARHSRDVAIARHVHAGNQRGIDARQARDEASAGARRDYLRDDIAARRDHARQLITVRDQFARAMATAERTVRLATANAQGEIDKLVAAVENTWRQAWVMAGSSLDAAATTAAGTRRLADARAERDAHVTLAAEHLTHLTEWAAPWNTPWADYQRQLAQADRERVVAVGNAMVGHAEQVSGVELAWSRDVAIASQNWTDARADAYQSQVVEVVAATDRLAAVSGSAQLTYDLLSSERTAEHDLQILDANSRREWDGAGARADLEQEFAAAGWDYERERLAAELEEQLARRQAELDMRLGSLTSEEYDRLLTESRTRLETRLRIAEQVRRQAEAAAETRRLDAEAMGRQAWTVEVAEVAVTWTDGMGSAAGALAGALQQAALDFSRSETLAGQNLAAAAATADQQHHIHLAIADAGRAGAMAAAEGQLDVTLVAAAADSEAGVARAKHTLQLAELTEYADIRRGQLATEPSAWASHQSLVADAQLTWANHMNAARDAYRDVMSQTAVEYAQAVNAADERLAIAISTADVSATTGRATAEAQRAVQYAEAAGDLTFAQTRAMVEQGVATVGAGRQYRTTLARAERDLAVGLAEADAVWTRTVAAAEAARYIHGETPEQVSEHDRVVAEATATREQAVQQLRLAWAGNVGTAGIARIEQLGSAEVDRASAFGDADVAFAEAVGNFMTLYTAQVTGHEELWVQSTTRARAEQASALASADAGWIAESTTAATELARQTALGQATLSAERAAAEADYHVQVAAPSTNRPDQDAPGSVLTMARASEQWLANLADEYVEFARGTAEADGQWLAEMVEAAAAVDRAGAAAELELADRRGALEFTHAANQSAAWGAYERTLVMQENRRRNTGALADKALDVAYAEGARRRAIDEAIAQRDFLLATAAGSADAVSHHQRALEVADSKQEEAWARADHTWTTATIAGESLSQVEHASAVQALRTAITGLDQQYYVQLSAAVENRQQQVAAAGADYAVVEFAAMGDLRERLAAEAATFEGAMRQEESLVRREIAESLGTDASLLHAELAEARLDAWSRQGQVFADWAADVRTVQNTYQQTVAEAYREHEVALAGAANAWIHRAAEAVGQARLGVAHSQNTYFLTHNGLAQSHLFTINDAQLDMRLRHEAARQELATGGSVEDFEQARDAAQRDFEVAKRNARFEFAAGETAARGRLRVAEAQAERDLVLSATQADQLFSIDARAIDAAFSELEGLAQASRENSLADLDLAGSLSGVEPLIEQLALRAGNEDNPPLQVELDLFRAERARQQAWQTATAERTSAAEALRLEFESGYQGAELHWQQASVAAELQRLAERAAAHEQRTEQDAANDDAHPQIASQGNAPPKLPQPARGPHKALNPAAPPQLPVETLDLDVTARLPLFTGPQASGRVRGQSLLPQGLRLAAPEATAENSHRHGPHLTAGVPTRLPLSGGAENPQAMSAPAMLTIGQLLSLAESADRSPAGSQANRIRQAATVQLALSGLVLRDAPKLEDFARFRDWLDAERSYRQELGRDVLQQGSEAQMRLWFGLREAVARDYFTPRQHAAGSIGAPARPDDFARQLAEERFQNLGFLERRGTLRHWQETSDHFWLGEYTDSVTAEGIAGEVGLSITGLDLPMDLRDLHYQLTNWQWTWEHAGKTVLYSVSVLPVVGAVKNAKYLEHLKHVDSTSSLARVHDRLPSLEAAADAGRDLSRQGGDAQRLLLPGSASCFVAGTQVLVAIEAPGQAAEQAADAMVAEMETAGWSACRRWTAMGLLALGTSLAVRNCAIPRRRWRDFGEQGARRRRPSRSARGGRPTRGKRAWKRQFP